ncbi:hypothetical protein F4677DRAFT_462963 [Hypoxylon crocopeplum]|nr:hypothetical protein F4677DRAFT_462963 [Hypoxylon crocopeplum]
MYNEEIQRSQAATIRREGYDGVNKRFAELVEIMRPGKVIDWFPPSPVRNPGISITMGDPILKYLRENVWWFSGAFIDNTIPPFIDVRTPYDFEVETCAVIRSWIQAQLEESQFLWLECPIGGIMSTKVYNSAISAGIPIITMAVEDEDGVRPLRRKYKSDQHKYLYHLIYSFASQLCNMLPDAFDILHALTEESLKQFNYHNFDDIKDFYATTVDEFDAALRVLDSLMNLAPPALIFIIECISYLETHKEVARYTKKLMDVLQRPREGKQLKFLLLTYGDSRILTKKLDSRDHYVPKRSII